MPEYTNEYEKIFMSYINQAQGAYESEEKKKHSLDKLDEIEKLVREWNFTNMEQCIIIINTFRSAINECFPNSN